METDVGVLPISARVGELKRNIGAEIMEQMQSNATIY